MDREEQRPESGLDGIQQMRAETMERVRRQQEALSGLRGLLAEFAAENLRLHQQTRAIIDSLNRDVRRLRRQMRRLGTARS